MNLAQALLMTGDWDAAETELAQAIDADGLADIDKLACYRAWAAALRGDIATAQAALAGLGDLRASEDHQDQAFIAVAEAFTAAARRQPAAALRHARTALGHTGALEISHESMRWAWPLAARSAHDLADTAATAELLAMLDGYRPGQLAPMQRAEGDLTRARLTADGGPDAGGAFAAAIAGLRQHSTPYHLAHGLLDHAEHLLRSGDDEAAGPRSVKPGPSPSGCAASRCSTARKPSSPPGPAPQPPDDGTVTLALTPGGIAAGQHHGQRPQRLRGAEDALGQAACPPPVISSAANQASRASSTATTPADTAGRRPHGTQGPRRQAPAGQATSAAQPAAPQIMCGTGRVVPGCSGLAATSTPVTAAAISISRPGRRAGRSPSPVTK